MILLIRLEVLYLLQLYQMKVCGRSMGFIGTRHLQKEYGKMAIWINFRKYMKRPWHFKKEKANVRYYAETDPAVHSQWPQIRMVHIAVPLIGKTYSFSHVKNVAVVSFDMGDILEKVLLTE